MRSESNIMRSPQRANADNGTGQDTPAAIVAVVDAAARAYRDSVACRRANPRRVVVVAHCVRSPDSTTPHRRLEKQFVQFDLGSKSRNGRSHGQATRPQAGSRRQKHRSPIETAAAPAANRLAG